MYNVTKIIQALNFLCQQTRLMDYLQPGSLNVGLVHEECHPNVKLLYYPHDSSTLVHERTHWEPELSWSYHGKLISRIHMTGRKGCP